MKSFHLEERRERVERERHSPWTTENYRYQNITKKLATGYIRGYWLMALFLLLLNLLYNEMIIKEGLFSISVAVIGVSVVGVMLKNKWVGLLFLILYTNAILFFIVQNPELKNIGIAIMLIVFVRYFYVGTVSLFKYNKFNKEGKEW